MSEDLQSPAADAPSSPPRPEPGLVRPDGSTVSSTTSKTERGRERRAEDEHFLPVIVKRSDVSPRHPDDVLSLVIEEGLEQLRRPFVSLTLSAIAAGLILGFSPMAVAVVTAATEGSAPLVQRIAGALVYPLGFLICIVGGAELFTEHTATAVYPVLDRRAGIGALLRLWVVVACGNLAGALASAGLLVAVEPVVGAEAGYIALGHHLTDFEAPTLLVSALLAGWLMALGAWLFLASPPMIAQIASIYVVTFLIGLGGFHHSIAGGVEIFTAWFLDPEVGPAEVVRFLGLALTGNILGGSLLVAVLNYAHIRKSREETP